MMSYLRRFVGPIRLRWSLQLCHFAAIGPSGARELSTDFVSVVIAQSASLRLESHRPQRKTRKPQGHDDTEHDAQSPDRRRVFGMVDPQRLKSALETVQNVIAQEQTADDV